MKKVLLVTLQGVNIGNRLQNYALQTVIERMGFEVYTPYYDIQEYDTLKKKAKCLAKCFLGVCGVSKYRYQMTYFKRKRAFSRFDGKYISNLFKIDLKKEKRADWERYDLAVAGSDQIWHRWSDDNNELEYFYLLFMPEYKRIAYAPSFGFSIFPIDDIMVHKKGISEMKYLSCREKVGVRLIDELTGRKAKQVLDPTLLLEKHDWRKIERKPYYLNEKNKHYILVYFLGEKSIEYRSAIDWIKEVNGAEVIDIFDTDMVRYYHTAPDEFIWLVDHAGYICTDSFHACVFSIIFHKKFMAFQRIEEGMDDMFDRVEDLLGMFDLCDRIFSGDIKKILEDYEVDSIENKRKPSIDFLYNALLNDNGRS